MRYEQDIIAAAWILSQQIQHQFAENMHRAADLSLAVFDGVTEAGKRDSSRISQLCLYFERHETHPQKL